MASAPFRGLDTMPIAGQWRAGGSGRGRADHDPYSGETLLEIPLASAEDLDAAYHGAREAQRGWANELPAVRSDVMRHAADAMERRRDEIVEWLIHESGSTRLKASMEWAAVHAVLLEAATLPHMVEGRILPADIPGKESRVYREPVGVVGVISPWNWPMQLSARSVAPALAVGNGVVLKPASDTPVTGGTLLARVLEEGGLPPGVLSVVIGAGSEIGDAMVTHPIPRVISFTGSTPVGRGIARLAAEAPIIKRVELELGGNSPLVVLEDANLDYAVDAAVFGRYLHQGQICMSANRLIVDDDVYDEFTARYVERVRGLGVGDPSREDTVIGPLINGHQLERLTQRINEARHDGARELLGGEPEGLVLPPHVFGDVPNTHPIAANELFGPVAPIVRAADEEDALRLANETEYGLSSAVVTGDPERGVRFARGIEAGMTHVNDQPVNDLPFSPFGGEKNSGIGRFNGRWAVDAFTTDHWISVQHAPRRYPVSARELDEVAVGGGG
jgi:aldehyde dehydrogenase (NAD+)